MEQTNAKYTPQDDEISLKELIFKLRNWYRYLLSKWLIILFTGVIGAAVGFYYVYVKKTVYTATSTFVLDEGDASGSVGRYAGIASMVGVDLGSSGRRIRGMDWGGEFWRGKPPSWAYKRFYPLLAPWESLPGRVVSLTFIFF